jgi:transcription-repair coupling factor (superfamily II helicase)
VEILSLTATPIPRTLNMAMSGIRDISIIATPPNHRLAVKTFVREHNKDIIKEAVMRELQRGGQVYYLHNKVTSIDKVAADLQALIPQATVKVAHGQMDKKQLERVMVEFYHRKFNVLVCTTIIENGIDIPTANTIIIDRADCFGLSQLHQLRGRVGRSHHQAYAFCFINNKKLLTKDSVKRLEALESLDTLGIGFTLATHDLEIRGSGELLGSEQSGNMQTIGFNLYMELLEHAISYLKQHKSLDNLEDSIVPVQVEIDLQLPALIPSDYIPDIATRLALYKKISKARTEHRLNDLIAEFIDRFGELPDALSNLFAITKLKIICQQLNIIKIKLIKQGFSIEFSATQSTTQLDNSNTNRKIDINKIINLLQKYPNKYKLISNNKLTYYENSTEQDRVEVVSKLLASVAIC